MNIFFASFKNEVRSSLRDRNPQIIIFIFLILTSLSTLIGWLTVRNVNKIFTDVKALGLTKAPNPFAGVQSLYYVRNSVIYIILVGSLMALILGVQSSLRERQSETAVLIKSRNVAPQTLYLGQIAAISTILLASELFISAMTFISIWLIQGKSMSLSSTLSLTYFLLISWVLLCGLSAIGILFGSLAKSEESAFLTPFVSWSVFVFVIPLVVTGVRPIALLNPTPSLSQSSGIPAWIHDLLNPFMLMEHFKAISNWLLGLDPTQRMNSLDITYFVAPTIVAVILPLLFAGRSFGKKLNA
jgi:ABC-2 type transport system permease protein